MVALNLMKLLADEIDGRLAATRGELAQHMNRLAACDAATSTGHNDPITIEQSIDLLLDVIPRAEAEVARLALLAERLRSHARGDDCRIH